MTLKKVNANKRYLIHKKQVYILICKVNVSKLHLKILKMMHEQQISFNAFVRKNATSIITYKIGNILEKWDKPFST